MFQFIELFIGSTDAELVDISVILNLLSCMEESYIAKIQVDIAAVGIL